MANKTIKILAIDDHADNLVVLKALINDSFPEIVFISAESGRKGFELCQAENPDVVLLDIVMPGMDGYEVCKKIKSDLRLRHIPVVMVTANRADKESRIKALDAGADAFLPKPVDESELIAQVKAMLRIKESEDLKKEEKQRLENMVLDRTEALENELDDRKKAENKLIISLDKITKNRQAILNLMEDLKVEISERKLVEDNIQKKNNELQFLNELSTELSGFSIEKNMPEFLMKRLKEFTGSEFLVYSDFDAESHVLITRHIEAEKKILNGLIKISGEKILNNPAPIHLDEKNFKEMVTQIVSEKESLNQVSFGAIPTVVDKAFSFLTGINRYFGISFIVSGDLFGTALLGFNSKQSTPSEELLKSFAHIAAISLQRRSTEVKLKESEEKYRLLIENQGEGLGIVDLDEKFVFVNPAAEEMFGVGKGGLLNRNLLDFVKPEQKAIIKRETRKRSNAEKSSYELEIIRPNLEQRTLLITATPQYTNDRVLSGTFGVFRDITERKQMEQKIIESEAYYRTLVDISPDGIILTDLEGNVAYGSIKAHEIFGVPPGENVLGSSILRWLTPESQNAIMERFMEIVKENIAPETREYHLIKNDGSLFWGELSSSPLTDSVGNPISLIIVCRDISERKKTEQELIKSRDKAEESDRLKTAFLHNISHEIRTPMNAIIGFSAMLGEACDDKESQLTYIDIITQSSNQLLSVVSDIIEISNIEVGLIKTYNGEVNLNNLISSLFKQFNQKAAEKGLELNAITMPDLATSTIITDETKLVKILSNLLSNAFKFTKSGKVEFGCGLRNNSIEFFVKDSGIGISKENHAKIFERFFQVENSISRQYEGTGLGLSISKAYVELLGGKIWLNSQPGAGSTFIFTIPYARGEKLLADENRNAVVEKKQSYEYKTVLIAEDEDNNFRLMSELLSPLNLKLIHAANGKEAVDICMSDIAIDLVLMDIKMPVMNGYEATTLIKKSRPSLTVIAQTAFAYESDREKVFAAGCDDYISKPIKNDVFVGMVKKYL